MRVSVRSLAPRVAPLTFLALSASAFGARTARADEGPERAQALYDEGVRYAEQGDCARAEPKLAESFRLESGVGVALRLADCEEKNGKLASAFSHFTAAESLARRSPTPENRRRAELAKQRAGTLEPRLAKLTIKVASRIDGMQLTRDDVTVPVAEWDLAVPVDRGPHAIRASAPGRASFVTSIAVEADGSSVSVEVPALAPEAGPAAPPALAPRPAERADGSAQRPRSSALPFVVGGAGLVAIGVGAFFGIRTLSMASDLKASCRAYPTCDPTRRDELTQTSSDAHRDATISTVAFVVGGVALAAGCVLLLTGRAGHLAW